VQLPFDVCVQSDSWKRPPPEVQAKVWNDVRYKELGAGAYQWTHNFLWNEPDSASTAYDNRNLSGLWTDLRESRCPRRDVERSAWTEVWTLNHRVTGISVADLAYTITVAPQERGYEIIQFCRADLFGKSKAVLRFVNENGTILTEWVEVSPGVFATVE